MSKTTMLQECDFRVEAGFPACDSVSEKEAVIEKIIRAVKDVKDIEGHDVHEWEFTRKPESINDFGSWGYDPKPKVDGMEFVRMQAFCTMEEFDIFQAKTEHPRAFEMTIMETKELTIRMEAVGRRMHRQPSSLWDQPKEKEAAK